MKPTETVGCMEEQRKVADFVAEYDLETPPRIPPPRPRL
ncbi:hypothetical protein NJ7G_0058 [Natrinema sp. J7-2]|nr:hypothetical protein NJ7G_0058 [Natrinema sp. J7-2]